MIRGARLKTDQRLHAPDTWKGEDMKYLKAKGIKSLAQALALIIFMFILLPAAKVCAQESMLDNPYVIPYYYEDTDGTWRKFFTISQPLPADGNAGETSYVWHGYKEYTRSGTSPSYWLPYGTTVETGIKSQLRDLSIGEHYYDVRRTGEIPVGKWVVRQKNGRCIHSKNKKSEWAGIRVGDDICEGAYYSGWISYCADCGEPVLDSFVYASKDRIETLRYLNMDYGYYYLCPNPACHHLENEGYAKPHVCKQVSPNRYVVVYDGNGGVPDGEGGYVDVQGRMLPSFHSYDNKEEFEGRTVEPVTHLTLCSFSRRSYTFDGWNTEPDGSGTAFADGQEILNLTEYNYLDENRQKDPRGYVTLYAQWIPTSSTLRIDPGFGTYDGEEGITEVTKGYGSSYLADPQKLVPRSIHRVSFQTNGGGTIAPMEVQRRFLSWRQEEPFRGKMKGDQYFFTAPNGNVDMLTALYDNEEIVLPMPVKTGYHFGGWFEDKACEKTPVGFGGENYLAKTSVTLYAKWSKLTLWSYDNYEDNDRKGAVDLRWEQTDATKKAYQPFVSEDGTHFTPLGELLGGEDAKVSRSFSCSGAKQTFVVPSTGFYEIEAFGARGGNEEAHGKQGGKGGKVTAKLYLTKGDVLTITVGGINGYGGGGKADAYARGGGATRIMSKREGLLLVAGGGGGATEFADGEAGGLETGLVAGAFADGENGGLVSGGSSVGEKGILETELGTGAFSNGEDGSAGGGGGYVGGKAGFVTRHMHTEACRISHVHGPECFEEHVEERICRIDRTPSSVNGWLYDAAASASAMDEYCPVCQKQTKKNVVHFHAIHDGCGAKPWGNVCYESGTGELFIHSTKHVCATCGYVFAWFGGYDDGSPSVTHTYHVIVSDRICPFGENGGCKYGYSQGQVLGSSIAYGGSSYVNPAAISCVKEAGVCEGDGSVRITSVMIGMEEENELKGVAANDLAAPEKVNPAHAVIDAITDSIVDVSFEAPKDFGTPYWFRVESYDAETGEKISTSNVTKNVLTTGIAGYYYIYDQVVSRTVTEHNCTNAGELLRETTLRLTLTAEVSFLHLAAVDMAGNIGPTTDIKLSKGASAADGILWPVVTRKVEATCQDPSEANVYTAPDGTCFVRADGITPFRLSFESFVNGKASEEYQITEQTFYFSKDEPGQDYRFMTILPKSRKAQSGVGQSGAGMTELSVSRFVRRGVGEKALLYDAGLTGAARSADLTWNQFWQCFVAPSSLHGSTVVVTPGAAAGEDASYRHSAWEADMTRALYVTLDGEAPVLTANQDFAALSVINADTLTDGVILFTASDALSGLGGLNVKVTNQDNGDSHVFEGDENGIVRIEYDPEIHLFDGDVTIEVTAWDMVFNRVTVTYGKAEFDLKATVTRILSPHDPVFKRGESGILHVTARGYADKICVEFPEAFKAAAESQDMPKVAGESWDQTFVYGVPQDEVTEELYFCIPLDLKEDGEFEIIVRAYKGERVLTERPQLCTVKVRGTILDELRTRLR